MAEKKFYAHTHGEQETDWQLLKDHLVNVADLAQSFAQDCLPQYSGFVLSAYTAGLLHDLGKYRQEFQEYLRGERLSGRETHHAIYGAAAALHPIQSPECAIAVAGHHSGLPRVEDYGEKLNQCISTAKQLLIQCKQDIGSPAPVFDKPLDADLVRREFLIRMLFSCLVDADWLDTARFMQKTESKSRKLEASLLLEKLIRCTSELSRKAQSDLNSLREKILQYALQRAYCSPGFFTMTVPTGGGKTLASMAFALAHSMVWNLRRIIVVIPYLSIIEQNAEIYRSILGEENLVEHHCAVSVQEKEENTDRLRFAVENWDAPIVVTTSVQFIESLFSNHPAQCRKLHNIARSVVIFDECQAIPHHVLGPFLEVAQELVDRYQVSMLFCSATQPALDTRKIAIPILKENLREIAPDPSDLFLRLKRVRYHFPQTNERLSWDELAERAAAYPQALFIVNTRRQAFELYQAVHRRLPASERESLYHLSSRMCAEHRSQVLGKPGDPDAVTIHGRLHQRLPCRVVSTQLVEAGVDIDFPVVFRAIGPLDSIVQAAGRCNREGRLSQPGEVFLFIPDVDPMVPPGSYETATQVTMSKLAEFTPEQLAEDPEIFPRFFHEFYDLVGIECEKSGEVSIRKLREKLNYPEVSKRMRVIPENTIPVVIPYSDVSNRIAAIRAKGFLSRDDLRRLQRFMVSLSPKDINTFQTQQALEPILPGVALSVVRNGFYSPTFGLLFEERETEDYIL